MDPQNEGRLDEQAKERSETKEKGDEGNFEEKKSERDLVESNKKHSPVTTEVENSKGMGQESRELLCKDHRKKIQRDLLMKYLNGRNKDKGDEEMKYGYASDDTQTANNTPNKNENIVAQLRSKHNKRHVFIKLKLPVSEK